MKNYGLIESIQDLGAYIFGDGNVPFVLYEENSDWTSSFVTYEHQSIPGFETLACTCFTVSTQIEIQLKKQYGVEKNYSDRWLAIVSGLNGTKGTDPQVVYEAVRKYGMIPEEMLPFDESIKTAEEYFSFKGADREACFAEGRKWLAEYDFKHEWLWGSGTRPENYLEVIKDAQRSCCTGLSVSAWKEARGEYVSDKGSVNNHFTLGVRFREGKEQIFDTYEEDGTNLKILAKDHNIRRAKRIYITNGKQEQVKTLMEKVIELLQQLFLLKKKVK